MRRDPEFFGEQDLDLVYIAKRLKDALRLEDTFTQAEIDYLIETDSYSGGLIFRTQRVGAFFYVAPEYTEQTRKVMAAAGFTPYATE